MASGAVTLLVREDGAGGARAILLRAPGATRVELSADFTGWQPAEARHVGGELWELRVRVAPGLHRLVVRLDGGRWTVPAGLPPAPDDFGGEVGVLVVH